MQVPDEVYKPLGPLPAWAWNLITLTGGWGGARTHMLSMTWTWDTGMAGEMWLKPRCVLDPTSEPIEQKHQAHGT